jgi:hypothetical protein
LATGHRESRLFTRRRRSPLLAGEPDRSFPKNYGAEQPRLGAE